MYAIVDIETTGGYSGSHKITEIAVFIHDGNKIIDEFQTLLNPERFIPQTITSLTGISNQMVENAPKFYEIAKELHLLTRDCIFVAHNVNFDYGFIRDEYKSLGGNFQRNKLCTVRLSRQLFPGHRSYSLGNICGALGISIKDRHRARGDAEATVKLFELLLEQDKEGIIGKAARRGSREATLPPNLPTSAFERVPEETGVYYFHDENGKVIYVGKAIDIRKRLLSHFTGTRKPAFMDKIFDISWNITGSELVALLLESHEIKRHYPVYNRMQKRTVKGIGLFHYEDHQGIQRLVTTRIPKNQQPLASFNGFDEARSFMVRMAAQYDLCPKCCGLQSSPNACFDYQIKKCRGVCAGVEDKEVYNKRVGKALRSLDRSLGDLMIMDKGRHPEERALVLIERGIYLGYGFLDSSVQLSDTESAKSYIEMKPENDDIKRILRMWIGKNGIRNNL